LEGTRQNSKKLGNIVAENSPNFEMSRSSLKLVVLCYPSCGDINQVKQHFAPEFQSVKLVQLAPDEGTRQGAFWHAIQKLISEIGVLNPHLMSTKVIALKDSSWQSCAPMQYVYSKSNVLKGSVACLSGFHSEERIGIRQVLQFLIHSLGGQVSSDLSEGCSHLVVGMTGTPKHLAATELLNKSLNKEGKSIEVVSKEWVEATFLNGSIADIAAFPVVPLLGHRISITGFKNEDRNHLVDLICKHGGQYESTFSVRSTHLLAASASGDKFKFALQVKVPVVNQEWLTDKIAAGGRVDDQDPKYTLTTGVSGANLMELVQYVNHLTATEQNQEESEELLDYFENSIIVLYGFQPELDVHLKKLVIHGGGIRLSLSSTDLIHPDATHIIVPVDPASGKATVSLTNAISLLNRDDVPIVNSNWLLECSKQSKLLPPDDFLVQW
jgi:BRCT domain type II-containing protein